MALGSEVNDNNNSAHNATQKVKKPRSDNNVTNKSAGEQQKKECPADTRKGVERVGKESTEKEKCPALNGNGVVDEGGGVRPPAAAPSYAAAAAAKRSQQFDTNKKTEQSVTKTGKSETTESKAKAAPGKTKVISECPMAKQNNGVVPNSLSKVNGDCKSIDISNHNGVTQKCPIQSDSNLKQKTDNKDNIQEIVPKCDINSNSSKTTNNVVNEIEPKIEVEQKEDPKTNGETSSLETKDKKAVTECNGVSSVNGDASGQEDDDDKKKEHEVLFIQDLGFTVKIVSPGVEPLDIQVSSMELVQEIHQLLMDREDTCHRTCFSLQLDGVTLDNFAELKNIEGLQEGSVIKVVEEAYTVREARIHVRHVRDLLKSLEAADAYTGQECASLAFLNLVTQGDILEKKKSRPESVDCTPPDYIMPGSKARPLLPLHLGLGKDAKPPQCVKVLTTSPWNPPPGPRKMNGDLLYLSVVTVEDKHLHITACPKGFYLNQSTEDTFNPRPATPSLLCHSLIDLLNIVSPTFKRSFATVQRRRTQKHPFERVATAYQVYQWASPLLDHTVDAIRAEDTFSSKLGYEEHIPGQTRDWNEELQTTRELPRKTLPERLLRERAIFKVHSDFVGAATRGAVAVVDGNVMAINPGEDAKMQMFIWNNIFFSLGFDVRDHYKDLGGDAAAFVAPKNDLQGVRVYSAVDLEGLYTLGTVIVDYRGFRVTAQSIIPGILEKEQEQSVIYGSIDFGKTVLANPKYFELLNKAGQQLKILPHSVISAADEAVELCSSVECKGIVGNDGRHYILDLLRTFPPDVNFLKLEDEELKPEMKAMGFPIIHKHKLCCLRQELVDSFVENRYFMFIRYAAFHLQQLSTKKAKESIAAKAIDAGNTTTKANESVEDKNENKTKVETKEKSKETEEKTTKEKEQQDKVTKKEGQKEKSETKKEGEEEEKATKEDVGVGVELNEGDEEIDADEAKKIMESITDSMYSGDKKEIAESTREVVRAAARMVGSLKESEFDVRFNPDVYSEGIRHAATPQELAKQRRLVKEAAEFLVNTQIPTFVRECLEQSCGAIMDGAGLVEALHARGVNARYLGYVAIALANASPRLAYLHSIAVAELLTRAAKHLFVVYLQCCDQMSIAAGVSHFLNCLVGGAALPAPPSTEEPARARGAGGGPGGRARGRNRRRAGGSTSDPNTTNNMKGNDWQSLTPKMLYQQIKAELKSYWGFDIVSDGLDSAIEKYGLQKISLLRSFCLKVGLQILLREYDFDNKNKSTFTSSDIVNIFPVVKHTNPRASDAYNFYTTGQSKIQSGHVSDGHELISEALNLLNNVYGVMHPEIAQCLRMVARLCYVTGEHRDAMAYQQKAVLMSERVNGIDHPHTITEYSHLALYCFANSQVSTALKLLYRARFLTLLVCGENHPEIALLDSNISLILHAVGEYELSLRFLERALTLNTSCHGPRSLKAAVSRHLLARTLSCVGDFRSALAHEKETYSIYKQQFGENHDKTRESSECLRHLTQQAVLLQKRLNEAGSKPAAPPVHIQPPSMGSVLDMLNVINGILFVQISQQDVEHLKAEMEKRQLKDLPITDSALEALTAGPDGDIKHEAEKNLQLGNKEAAVGS